MAAIMDTSGTGCDAAAAMEGLTVEGLSARQLEVMQQLLESLQAKPSAPRAVPPPWGHRSGLIVFFLFC